MARPFGSAGVNIKGNSIVSLGAFGAFGAASPFTGTLQNGHGNVNPVVAGDVILLGLGAFDNVNNTQIAITPQQSMADWNGPRQVLGPTNGTIIQFYWKIASVADAGATGLKTWSFTFTYPGAQTEISGALFDIQTFDPRFPIQQVSAIGSSGVTPCVLPALGPMLYDQTCVVGIYYYGAGALQTPALTNYTLASSTSNSQATIVGCNAWQPNAGPQNLAGYRLPQGTFPGSNATFLFLAISGAGSVLGRPFYGGGGSRRLRGVGTGYGASSLRVIPPAA